MDFEKSMKYTNKKRTICEVVRECNDVLNNPGNLANCCECGGSESFVVEVCKKLHEIHDMAKRMTKKLYKYSKEWDKDFWKDNPDYEEDLKRRLNE